MSSNYTKDMTELHTKFGVQEAVKKLSPELLLEFLNFRINFIEEEFTELKKARDERNMDDVVDAFIDLAVIAIGSLEAAGVDVDLAWNRVLDANMSKNPGVNPNRPNKFGLPDMVKPLGWVAPSHADNLGVFSKL